MKEPLNIKELSLSLLLSIREDCLGKLSPGWSTMYSELYTAINKEIFERYNIFLKNSENP